MWAEICPFLCVMLLLANANPNDLPMWSWDCVNEKCISSKSRSLEKVQSLTSCNMLCGAMQLWPHPTGPFKISASAVPVRADLFQLQVLSVPSKAVRAHLTEAFKLFLKDLRYMEQTAFGFSEWHAVAVQVTINGSRDPRMRLNTDESYNLLLRPRPGSDGGALEALINSSSFCGARHGLESLLQLTWFDPYTGSLMLLGAADVQDAPRFKYRGLLLDTARNYFPVSDLLRTIDAMSACKLNTFHWHISDSQGFPLHIRSVPQLTQHGAHGTGALYSSIDVRKVVRHAKYRGIRVLMEIDTPAHAGTAWDWGPSYSLNDLLLCLKAEPWTAYCSEPPCGQLNPRNPHVYDLLEAIYSEIVQLTGVDDIFHLGGGQISEQCWQEHFDDIDPMELWLEFTRSALSRLESAVGKKPNLTILWASQLSKRIKEDLRSFVHGIGLQARSSEWAQKSEIGIRTVISHEDPWDLNSGMGEWHEETGGSPYNPWQRVYEHRPWNRGELGWVEGGEATVWSSTLAASGLDARIWPRAAALAERLWSDLAEGATRAVHARLDVHRTRLLARGVGVAPMWSMWCTHHVYSCG